MFIPDAKVGGGAECFMVPVRRIRLWDTTANINTVL